MSFTGSLKRLVSTTSPSSRAGVVASLLPSGVTKIKPSRSFQTAATRSRLPDQHNVPVQQQGSAAAEGGASGRNSSAVQRQSQQQTQQQRPGGGLRSRRGAAMPGSFGLTPLADASLFAPGFGRMGSFLRSIEDEMNRMQTLSAGEPAGSVATSLSPDLSDTMVPMHVDLIENEKDVTIKADVPGMSKSDIQVEVDPEGLLTISGERKIDHAEPADGTANGSAEGSSPAAAPVSGFRRIERKFGRFARRFSLPPQKVNMDGISAKVDKGVLTVTIPKIEEAKEQPRRINVQ